MTGRSFLVALFALLAFSGVSARSASAATGVIPGVHDTAINDCVSHPDPAHPGQRIFYPSNKVNIDAAGESFNDGKFPAGITTLRVTVPWDVALPSVVESSTLNDKSTQPQDEDRLTGFRYCLNKWLRVLYAHGRHPEIDFRGDAEFAEAPDASGKRQLLMPNVNQYLAAMKAFDSDYVGCGSACKGGGPEPLGGQVSIIVPWNEPDNQGGGKVGSIYNLLFPDGHTHLAGQSCPANPNTNNCGATFAGWMWALDHIVFVQGGAGAPAPCGGCTIPAGDFSSGYGMQQVTGGACGSCKYLWLYNAAATASGSRPAQWAVHPYSDVQAFQSSGQTTGTHLAEFANKLASNGYGYHSPNTTIWLNEVSACNDNSQGTCSQASTYAKNKLDGVNFITGGLGQSIPAGDPQVGQIAYYCYRGSEGACSDDWGLEANGNSGLNASGQAYACWAAQQSGQSCAQPAAPTPNKRPATPAKHKPAKHKPAKHKPAKHKPAKHKPAKKHPKKRVIKKRVARR